MRETSKSFDLRHRRGDFNAFLNGSGIDIGAGADPLQIKNGSVRAYDLIDGDAQFMNGINDSSFDFVYSSHCLEHILNVDNALYNWVRILKPSGFLYIVIPDYILYEHLCWPSVFNLDHKTSYSLSVKRSSVGRSTHYCIDDIESITKKLGIQILRAEIDDDGFDYNKGFVDQTLGNALAQICIVAQR